MVYSSLIVPNEATKLSNFNYYRLNYVRDQTNRYIYLGRLGYFYVGICIKYKTRLKLKIVYRIFFFLMCHKEIENKHNNSFKIKAKL